MDANVVQQTKQKAIIDTLIEQRDSALNAVCNLHGDISLYKARITELETLYADLMGKYQNTIGERDKYKTLIDAAVSNSNTESQEQQHNGTEGSSQDDWQEAETVTTPEPTSPAPKQNFSKKHSKR